MKLLLVSFSNNYDHQLSLYSLYESMIELGVDVYTCGIKDPKVNFNFTDRNIFVDAPIRPGIVLSTFKIWKINKVRKLIKEKQIDTIYFESLHTWNLLLMKKKYHIKVFHCLHDLIPHSGKNAKMVSIFNKIVFKKSDCVILRGKFAVNYCELDEKLSKYRVEFLPIGRKWIEYRPCNHTKQVLFFGRITKYKGIDNLIKIIKECRDIQFQVIGRPLDHEDKKMVEIIRSLPNVSVDSNYVSEEKMEEYFNNADITLLPYISATQSGVIVDSYRYSRPCIAFDVGDISNQIIDQETGYLIKNNDLDDFIKKLYLYINKSNIEKDEICKNAYQLGENLYSSRNVSKKLLNIINNLDCVDRNASNK